MATSSTWLASASRTTTQTSADIDTSNFQNLIVTVVTTVIGTGSITLTINAKDPASGTYRLLLAGVPITTNTTNVYKVTRNLAAVANVSALDDLPEFIQLVMTANNANAATYSVGYDLD